MVDFTPAELAAFRDGRKTQFRVLLDPQPHRAVEDMPIKMSDPARFLDGGCVTYPGDDYLNHKLPHTPGDLIHLPDLTLRVTDVKAERACDISEEDAIAEGCRPYFDEDNLDHVPCPNGDTLPMAPLKGPVDDFKRKFTTTHGHDAWDMWVAAYTVERIEDE